MKRTPVKEAVFRACIDEVPMICQFVTDPAREYGMDDKSVWKLEIALDEACTNIVCYGYQEDEEGRIWVYWDYNDNEFSVTVEDTGLPFDQSEPTTPDFSSDICQRKAGGLGRYIMRKFLDDMSYHRKNGKNTLTLVKKINTEETAETC